MLLKRDPLWSLLLAASVGILLAAMPLSAQPQRKFTQVAEGVYAIEHPDVRNGVRDANTTVIIGDRQVLVVDTGFVPSVARADIAQIRQWTQKPVSFVVNTHFHNDHNFGNRAYMDAFPALTIIAHVETRKSMDMFGPGTASREQKTNATLQKMLETGKDSGGTPLMPDDINEVKQYMASRVPLMDEINNTQFQSATLTFDHDFTIDLGNREVQVKFLGRGNTAGDAVVYLPKEKIVVTGDLVSFPIPSTLDGYPAEWVHTMQNLAQLEADTILPGHGPVMHDKTYMLLVRDFVKSAVDQVYAKLTKSGPGMFQSLDDVRAAVDLKPFRQRFAGTDENLGARFDAMAASLVKITFEEASLR